MKWILIVERSNDFTIKFSFNDNAFKSYYYYLIKTKQLQLNHTTFLLMDSEIKSENSDYYKTFFYDRVLEYDLFPDPNIINIINV